MITADRLTAQTVSLFKSGRMNPLRVKVVPGSQKQAPAEIMVVSFCHPALHLDMPTASSAFADHRSEPVRSSLALSTMHEQGMDKQAVEGCIAAQC